MKIHHEIADEFTYGTKECEGFTFIEKVKGESSRWSVTSRVVISKDGKFYSFEFEQGLTENQEVDRYYPDAEGMIELKEVFPETKTITIYK